MSRFDILTGNIQEKPLTKEGLREKPLHFDKASMCKTVPLDSDDIKITKHGYVVSKEILSEIALQCNLAGDDNWQLYDIIYVVSPCRTSMSEIRI